MGVRLELDDLPPRYRAQAEMQIAKQKGAGNSLRPCGATSPAAAVEARGAPESEKRYYRDVILPKVAAGRIAKVQEQVVFELLPEKAYCGLKLPKARYTPDFVLTYADGTVEIVEVKAKFTRRMQRDYIYRRRLFIDLVAEPRGWRFTEWFADKED